MEYKVVIYMKDDRRDMLEAAARRSPEVARALSGLSPGDMERLRAVLADPEKTKQVLATPEARQLLQKMIGEGKK